MPDLTTLWLGSDTISRPAFSDSALTGEPLGGEWRAASHTQTDTQTHESARVCESRSRS